MNFPVPAGDGQWRASWVPPPPPHSPAPPGTPRGRIRVRYIQIRPRGVPGGAGECGGGGGTQLARHWPSSAGTGKFTVFKENPLKVAKSGPKRGYLLFLTGKMNAHLVQRSQARGGRGDHPYHKCTYLTLLVLGTFPAPHRQRGPWTVCIRFGRFLDGGGPL